MHDHWTAEQLAFLGTIEDLDHLGDFALAQIREIRPAPLVMVCGPMTSGGLPTYEANAERFRNVHVQLHCENVTFYNQLPLQAVTKRVTTHHSGGEYCTDILERIFRPLLESDYIYKVIFLPEWERSRGAAREHEIAQAKGLIIEYYPAELLSAA